MTAPLLPGDTPETVAAMHALNAAGMLPPNAIPAGWMAIVGATLTAPCPRCGRQTVAGWENREEGRSVWPPTVCTGCRAAALGAAMFGMASAPVSPDTGSPLTAAGSTAPVAAAAGVSLPRSGPRPVEVRDGILYVNGERVAEGIDPDAITVLGRRVCVNGRQVATIEEAP